MEMRRRIVTIIWCIAGIPGVILLLVLFAAWSDSNNIEAAAIGAMTTASFVGLFATAYGLQQIILFGEKTEKKKDGTESLPLLRT